MTLLELLGMLVKFGLTSVEPLVAQAIEDWKNDKITAEEADKVAEGKFSAMLTVLANPRAESLKLDLETERLLHQKFDTSDKPTDDSEEPK